MEMDEDWEAKRSLVLLQRFYNEVSSDGVEVVWSDTPSAWTYRSQASDARTLIRLAGPRSKEEIEKAQAKATKLWWT